MARSDRFAELVRRFERLDDADVRSLAAVAVLALDQAAAKDRRRLAQAWAAVVLAVVDDDEIDRAAVEEAAANLGDADTVLSQWRRLP